MAIRAEKKRPLNALEYVSVNDDAIDLEASDIDDYKKTGDASKLKYLPNMQPTIFLLNFELKGRDAELIKNSLFGGKDADGKPQVTMGTWSFVVAQVTLKDIRNPDGLSVDEALVFRKNEKGNAHADLIATLERFGIVDEISSLYSTLTMTRERANAKNS